MHEFKEYLWIFCLPGVVWTASASVICLTVKKPRKLYTALLLNKLVDNCAEYSSGSA